MRVRINLDTMSDVQKFVEIVSRVDAPVILKDSAGHCVSGSSLLGALYTMEWSEVYCECEKDITYGIFHWIV